MTEIPSVKRKTEASIEASPMRGTSEGATTRISSRLSSMRSKPANPPTTDSTRLSVSSWRSSLLLDAPSAERIATSVWREL